MKKFFVFPSQLFPSRISHRKSPENQEGIQLNSNFHRSKKPENEKKKLFRNWFCDVICLVFPSSEDRRCKKREKNGKTMNYKLSIHRILRFSFFRASGDDKIFSQLSHIVAASPHWFIEGKIFWIIQFRSKLWDVYRFQLFFISPHVRRFEDRSESKQIFTCAEHPIVMLFIFLLISFK